jgi:hypothetical protein
MESERRYAPRYSFSAEAEVTEILSNTKFMVRASDLSVSGIFLDMLNPFPKGTDVRVRISHQGKTFTAFGKVVFVLPNMGMGVVLRSVEDIQLAVLKEWLSKLGRAEHNGADSG